MMPLLKGSGMKRRQLIGWIGGAAIAWPIAVLAQSGRTRRIAVFISGSERDPEMQSPLAAFKEALQQLKWIDGTNVRVDYRFADGKAERYTEIAKEIVALRPDVILVRGTPNTAALLKETRTIPIVFVGVSDPVGAGLIESLARPGGNVTGHLLYEPGITGKWLALLKEIAPSVSRAALMSNPRTGPFEYFVRSAKAVAPALGVEVESGAVETSADIERVVASLGATPSGLIVLPDASTLLHRDFIIAQAARHRVPTVYGFRVFVDAGGLASYDSDITDHYRQAASYVDRILRGTVPSELPAQTPTRYETIINLKTARTLGLTVPATLLVRADQVIE